jgi:hypothetical protein
LFLRSWVVYVPSLLHFWWKLSHRCSTATDVPSPLHPVPYRRNNKIMKAARSSGLNFMTICKIAHGWRGFFVVVFLQACKSQQQQLKTTAASIVEDRPIHSLTTIAIHKKKGEESLNRFKARTFLYVSTS